MMEAAGTGPIDVVMTWVDGDDPAHRAKMRPYLGKTDVSNESIAGETRFRQVNEIFYSVASVLRFAPFVRTIFIVTDAQNPRLDDFVDRFFPDRTTRIEIIDHKDIFRGYEQYLPVFNSRSIGTCLFRIPGLAENYVQMEDDFFLTRPARPEDWFAEGKLAARGMWRLRAPYRMVSNLRPNHYSFKDSMMNAARIAGYKCRFFLISHTPHAQKKSVLERFYTENPGVLEQNISHRFRYKTQYTQQTLCYLLAFKVGLAWREHERELYIKPVERGDGYLDRKFADFDKHKPMSVCIQSLDMASEADRNRIVSWLGEIIGVKL